VTLAPFFLARHELTQTQWARLWSGDASLRWPSWYRIGEKYRGVSQVLQHHPVEHVSWEMCDLLLRQCGLLLPTEAQWEYGCRAGSTAPWYPGGSAMDLAGHANVRDRTAAREQPEWGTAEEFDDRYCGPAPVGTYASNRFGLFDVHGNVAEWCRDWYGSYGAPTQPGDGLRLGGVPSANRGNRVYRGSGYDQQAVVARSAARSLSAPTYRNGSIGVRPARALRPRDAATSRPAAR
jgi:formylglycine-generating enzyme required for sulfatase activity